MKMTIEENENVFENIKCIDSNEAESIHREINLLSSQSMQELWESITSEMPDDREQNPEMIKTKNQELAGKLVSNNYVSKLPKPF